MTRRAYFVIENDFDDATLATSQTPATGYDAELLQNAIRDDEWHSQDTTSQTITGTWSAAKTVNHFSIHHHGLYGASVRFQCGAYDSGTIAVADFTSPAIVVDDYLDSDGAYDPYAYESSFWLDFADANDDQFVITFSGTPRDYAYFWASRIFVGRAQWFEHTASLGSGYRWWRETQTKVGRTFGGSKRANRGESWRRSEFDLNAIQTAESAVLEDLYRRHDIGGDFVMNPFAGEGTRRERNGVYAGTLSQINPLVASIPRLSTKISFEEN